MCRMPALAATILTLSAAPAPERKCGNTILGALAELYFRLDHARKELE